MLNREFDNVAGGSGGGAGAPKGETIASRIGELRKTFKTGKTQSFEWRLQQLTALKRFLTEQEDAIAEALKKDLGKSQTESVLHESGFVANECDHAIKHLKKWMAPEKVSTPLATKPSSAEVAPEPLGTVLIMGAWNFPVEICLAPLVGAIAAGNCVVLKPSEMASATSKLLAEKLPAYLDPDCIKVIEGDAEAAKDILQQKFDHIFFTGSAVVGKKVMEAAAQHLTPVTLELGGKSPVIIDKDTDIETTARRVAWGKFTNAGQVCIAPDYVLIHEDVHDAFVDAFKKAVKEFFGDDPQKSPDFGRIINEKHFNRVKALMGDGPYEMGGKTDAAGRYISPTLLTGVDMDHPAMKEEIFGPVLPVMKYSKIEEALDIVNAGEKPLVIYAFTRDKKLQGKIEAETSSGTLCFNDTLVFQAIKDLPFGGVGASGMGRFHGKYGFETFSHGKAVLKRGQWPDPKLRYPPYSKRKLNTMRKLLP